MNLIENNSQFYIFFINSSQFDQLYALNVPLSSMKAPALDCIQSNSDIFADVNETFSVSLKIVSKAFGIPIQNISWNVSKTLFSTVYYLI